MAIAKANNSLQRSEAPNRLSAYLEQQSIRSSLMNSMGADKANKFVADLLSVAANNPGINSCDYRTVVSAAMMANALNLPMSPQLGYCYVVPFDDNRNNRTVGTFVLGYKGYIQLAERTGYYKNIVVLEIKESEFRSYNPLTETLDAVINEDNENRDAEPTVGYYAMFELLSGFTKAMYWSVKKMKAHAIKYSRGYEADVRKGTAWTFWSKDFDGMAKKTMLRQLIGKWGIMSTEMQKAIENDKLVNDLEQLPDFSAPDMTPTEDEQAEIQEPDADTLFGEINEEK